MLSTKVLVASSSRKLKWAHLSQARMNQRPLVAISDDKDDGNILTLTLHHIKMRKPLTILPSSLDEMDIDKMRKIKVVTRWNQRKILQQKFFIRFMDEYLDSLKT